MKPANPMSLVKIVAKVEKCHEWVEFTSEIQGWFNIKTLIIVY
jgi:hypothetical protein